LISFWICMKYFPLAVK